MLWKKKILVVDDEEIICRMAKKILDLTGKYKVKIETDSYVVVETARKFKPDLILLDIVMPDPEGLEVSRQLLNDSQLQGVPVVFMTGILTDDEVDDQKGTMANRPCIAKPITKDKLLMCVEENLK